MLLIILRVTCRRPAPHPGGEAILLVASYFTFYPVTDRTELNPATFMFHKFYLSSDLLSLLVVADVLSVVVFNTVMELSTQLASDLAVRKFIT